MEINIQELTLLSKEEYESNKDKAPFFGEDCWLRSPSNIKESASVVYPDTSIRRCSVYGNFYAVRPALRIGSIASKLLRFSAWHIIFFCD